MLLLKDQLQYYASQFATTELNGVFYRTPTPAAVKGWRQQSGDDFVFAGKIGTGFDTKLLLQLREQLDKIEIAKPPFTKSVGLPRVRAHWVKPEIVVQVGFIEWTVHGKLRHPRLLGVHTDKDAREVVKE